MMAKELSIQIVLRLKQQPMLLGEIEIHGLLEKQAQVVKAILLNWRVPYLFIPFQKLALRFPKFV